MITYQNSLSYVSKLHVFVVVNGWNGDLALGYKIVIVDIIAEAA